MAPASTSPEAHFVLACLRDDVETLRDALRAGADFDAILTYAHHYEVVDRVHRHLRAFPEFVPEPLRAALDVFARTVATHNDRLARAAGELAAAFAAADVDMAFSKGLAFDFVLHEGRRTRLSKDLDIYVASGDVHAACRILRKIGFYDQAYPLDEDLARSQHHGMYSESLGVTVELHWALAPPYRDVRIDVGSVVARSVPAEIAGATLWIPRLEHLPLLLCVEMEKDNWSSLKHLADFSRLMTLHETYDFDVAIRFVVRKKKHRALLICVNMLLDLGLGSAPQDLARSARSDGTARLISQTSVARFRRGTGPLPLGARLLREILFLRRQDSFGANLASFWRSVLWRLSRVRRYRSRRRAARPARDG